MEQVVKTETLQITSLRDVVVAVSSEWHPNWSRHSKRNDVSVASLLWQKEKSLISRRFFELCYAHHGTYESHLIFLGYSPEKQQGKLLEFWKPTVPDLIGQDQTSWVDTGNTQISWFTLAASALRSWQRLWARSSSQPQSLAWAPPELWGRVLACTHMCLILVLFSQWLQS